VFLLQDEDQNRKEIGKEDEIMTLKWEMQASKNHLLVEHAKPEFKIWQCLKNFVCGERQSFSHSKLCMHHGSPHKLQACRNETVEHVKPEFQIRSCLKGFGYGKGERLCSSRLCMLQWEPTHTPTHRKETIEPEKTNLLLT